MSLIFFDKTKGQIFFINLLLIPFIFYYPLSEFRIIAVASYAFMLGTSFYQILIRKSVIKAQAYIIILSTLIFAISLVTFENFGSQLLAFRLNFGFFILLLFFIPNKPSNINKMIVFLSLWTIVEYLLIRITPELIFILPHFDETYSISFTELWLGGTHSFGGNRTVTGVLLTALFAYQDRVTNSQYKYKYLTLIGVFCAGSGAAFLLLIMYFLIKNYKNLKYLIVIVIPVFFIVFMPDENEVYLIGKLNFSYIEWLFNYKSDQIIEYWNSINVIELIFGMGSESFKTLTDNIIPYGSFFGDFIILDFIARYGLVGLLFTLLIINNNLKRETTVPLLIILIGTLHYHVLFSMPGQLITVLLLTIKDNHSVTNVAGGKKV
jgi:hypothetical protein